MHLVVLFLCCGIVTAQTTYSNDTLHWDPAYALSAADFKGEPQEYTGLGGENFCMILVDYSKPNVFAKTTIHGIALFDRNKSWLSKAHRNANGLSFFQTMFDLYELHARKFKKWFADDPVSGDPKAAFEERYNATMSALTEEFNAFRKDTRMGVDAEQLALWNARVREEIAELSAYGEK